ncbi:MAG: Nudix family hydrolase [Gammaproteobacteria bacterium]|nr:Nudix family hydrolase [Gammaproteobacteria bacterium]
MYASTQNIDPDCLRVAVAVIRDKRARVLIAKRPDNVDQGDLWEFPGGKLESGESSYQALLREIKEELDLEVVAAHPLIQIPYCYPDRKVLLDVWLVDEFQGVMHACEGQPVQWVSQDLLAEYSFPQANRAIIHAIRLSDRYLITPDSTPYSQPMFLDDLRISLEAGVRLVQYRDPLLSAKDYQDYAGPVVQLCQEYGADILLNADAAMVSACGAQGVHLNGDRLWSLSERPLGEAQWVAASCHTRDDLLQAARIGVDFVVLSPVKVTQSHPHAVPIGMAALAGLIRDVGFPVYALGGMLPVDLGEVRACGAQGIAAITGLYGVSGYKACQ